MPIPGNLKLRDDAGRSPRADILDDPKLPEVVEACPPVGTLEAPGSLEGAIAADGAPRKFLFSCKAGVARAAGKFLLTGGLGGDRALGVSASSFLMLRTRNSVSSERVPAYSFPKRRTKVCCWTLLTALT